MTRWPLLKFLAGVLAAALLIVCIPQRAAADDNDPPARVARLRSVQGSVSVQPAGADDWGAAGVNRPITTGDKLWSDQDSRAELSLGSAAIRLGSQTAFTILNLDDQIAQISINEGTVNVHLRTLGDNEAFEIDTPNLAFSLLRPGDYRVGVNENGDTTIITVRGGQGSVIGGGQAFTVYPNQTATFVGTDQLTPDIGTAVATDDFDSWCVDLNSREDRAPRYVSQDVVGYEDLDDNGRWQNVPEYGQVWVPNGVVAGWQPYRYGHWTWIAPWGWTWVDDASWGYAPFHYGRWVMVGGYWGWTPGPVVVGVRPVYAPALVAWVGGGVGVGVGVAWFPLGPREVYMPPYAVSRTYVTNVNVTNTVVERTYVTNVYNNYQTHTNVTNVTYVNRTYVTATSQNAFTSAQPISRNVVQVNATELARAPVGTAVGAGVAPQPRSQFGEGRTTGVARPPAAAMSRPVVAKAAPPPAPISFASQQKAIQANAGKPLAPAQLSAIRPAPSMTPRTQVRVAPPVTSRPPAAAVGNKPGQPPAANKPPTQPAAGNKPAVTPPAQPAKPANNAAGAPPARPDRPPTAQPAYKPPPANANQPPKQPATNSTEKPNSNTSVRPPATPPAAAKPEAPATESKPPAAESKPPANQEGQPKPNADKPPKKTDKKPPKEKPDKDKDKP
ncbi:MAG: DUF6600 domain-containing protein [Candidatus Acidiferrales bacterium]|jgi:hypothetical protein